MGKCDEVYGADSPCDSRASLRIFSETLTCANVTEVLGTKPSRGHDIGDVVSARSPMGPRRKKALWLLQSNLDPARPLSDHIAQIISFIEDKGCDLRQLQGRIEVDVFCFFSSPNGQGGFTLGPALLTRLARAEVELTVDLYPPQSVNVQ